MNTAYGYQPRKSIKHFKCLRIAACWAGWLGVIQSLIWMALTIMGIVAYNCEMPVDKQFSYGSLMQTIFLDLYYDGSCGSIGYNTTMLRSVETILDPEDVLIWTAVYLAWSVYWLITSVLLLTLVRKDHVKVSLIVLWHYIFAAFCIWAMDLALGVIFGIDYSKFNYAAYGYGLNAAMPGPIQPNAAILVAAMVTSISFMIIALKGFVLWIINVVLWTYLLIQTIRIHTDKDGNDTLFMLRKESDEIMVTNTRPPISAFEENKPAPNTFNNEAFVPDNRSQDAAIELNQESIARAARMSTDASLQDRRFRNLDAFQQFPPPRYNPNKPEVIVKEEVVTATVVAAPFPQPDYSPPMSRQSQPGNGNAQLRGHRYH